MEANSYGWCRHCRTWYYKLFNGVCRDCLDIWAKFPYTRPPACPKVNHSGHTHLECPEGISETGYVSS